MKIYHYPKCGKSREGMAILKSHTNDFETKLYMKEGLRKEEIEEELEFKTSKPLEDELYEIKDTLKKLNNE